MDQDKLLPFALPSVGREGLGALNGVRLTSNNCGRSFSLAGRLIGLAVKLATEITKSHDSTRVVHKLPDVLRARILAFADGFESPDPLQGLGTKSEAVMKVVSSPAANP